MKSASVQWLPTRQYREVRHWVTISPIYLALKGAWCYNMEHYNIIFHGLKTWICWISQRTGSPREKYDLYLFGILKSFIRCDTDLTLSGWFTSIFWRLTWHQNISPVLVDYFGTYCSCSVPWSLSVLNRAEPYWVRETCHFCYPISAVPCLQLGPDVCSLQQ